MLPNVNLARQLDYKKNPLDVEYNCKGTSNH